VLSKFPNTVLKILKWPVAIVAVLLLPASVYTYWDLVHWITAAPESLTGFGVGVAGYVACWWLIFKRQFSGSLFSTAEHELTHAIFAWMTLHWVIGFKATWNEGGEVSYEGEGNWLITIAPYWFPTLSLPFAAVIFFTDAPNGSWPTIGLGATLAYHVTSTWRETHAQQTDLHKTGFPFAWMFLPAANLITYAILISYAHGGADGVAQVYQSILGHSVELWAMTGIELPRS